MNKLNGRTDFIGLVIVFIIFISTTISGLLLHAQNQKMAVEQKQKKEQLLLLEHRIKAIQNSISQAKNPRIDRKLEPDLIMNQENPEVCMGELKRLAEIQDLRVIQNEIHSKPGAMRNYPQYQITQLLMEVSGDYPRLMEFLEELPRSRSIVRLSSFKVMSEYKRLNDNNGIGYQLKARLIIDLISRAVTN